MISELSVHDLADMTLICNAAMPLENTSMDIVKEKTFGFIPMPEKPELGAGYWENSQTLVGFVWVTMWSTGGPFRGGIRLLAVHPQHQRQGIGTQLLLWAENRLHELGGVRTLSLASIPGNYLTPGINPLYLHSTCFARSRGFVQGALNQNLSCPVQANLGKYRPLIHLLESEGYRFQRGRRRDLEDLIAFTTHGFSFCEEEIRRAFSYEKIGAHIVWHNDLIVAFTLVDSNNQGTGSVGPSVVVKKHRRKGLLKALCELQLVDLAALGKVWAIWAWCNPVLEQWSSDLGGNRIATYWNYVKSMH